MQKIPVQFQISYFLVAFLIFSAQFGVGALGFQRIIAMSAGYDGWMGVIIAGAFLHFIIWCMYKIFEKSGGEDIVSVHQFVFGKWIGGFLSFLFSLYFTFAAITVLRTYIEVVQVWMFPNLQTWLFALMFMGLVYYIVSAGFRAVTGIAYLGIILPAYLLLTFIIPFEYMNFRHLLPVFDHSVKDILLSAKDMTLTFIGLEALIVFYPFVKNHEKSVRWAHLGVLATTLTYLFMAVLTFSYFSEEKLAKNIWATLSLWKIIELPFVERIEYIGIANWCLIILPNVCIFIWCASRIGKRVFQIKHKKTLLITVIIVFAASLLFEDRKYINDLNNYFGQAGFYVIYVYIPMLWLLVLFAKWRKERKNEKL
ncbi:MULTISPECIES: GerAB/ArcD/ProY family transporter [Sutcliffiella]|uniref:Spore gernimation protein GerB n=1 Tax=Sutcliffiella cohnii TaxID=33932 RepID=A0A223KQ42_9BACI|nr:MULTISPECIES: GerAB/ArcD/ProY family transporter [Sutcliffiella]AST91458.1 spore gernimation protein GerB [Sutcliffiella cohnii]WBL17286.1 GerAB/ArcD/ProY family transporter [Sutcliffiella sp. NC1]